MKSLFCSLLCVYWWFIYFGASLVAQTVKYPPVIPDTWLNPWVGKIPWRKEWLSIPVFWPGKSHGQRSWVGDSPWDLKESDMTERLTLTYYVFIWNIFTLSVASNFIIYKKWNMIFPGLGLYCSRNPGSYTQSSETNIHYLCCSILFYNGKSSVRQCLVYQW